MPRKSSKAEKIPRKSVKDYRHSDSRKNIPPAKISAEGRTPELPKSKYFYNPRIAPVLRFDESGDTDRVIQLLESIKQNNHISEDDLKMIESILHTSEPWLEWTSKRESKFFEVEPVALHIHERISSQAILKIASRDDVERDLFADPVHDYWKAIQFYQHDMNWSNRLILGDSAQVMTSLAQRENLAGQVQMIFVDPPYGIRFGSNFQVKIGDRKVEDQAKYLSREPEMIRAYRDTWSLGVHSYLNYLRDRLIIAHSLLNETGSIFVQIGDENQPLISILMDEVFGRSNRIQIITFKKKSSTRKGQSVVDYLLWYAKNKEAVKMPDLYRDAGLPEDTDKYRHIELDSGEHRLAKLMDEQQIQEKRHMFVRLDYPVVSQGGNGNRTEKIVVEGKEVFPGKNNQWRYDPEVAMKRLEKAERLRAGGKSAYGITYWGDSRLSSYPNVWTEFHGASNPDYVVQTNEKVIERCLLMSTEPGDLVIDPTCGSGTTALMAEKWGRRWITIDTSRVAIATARQKLITSVFDYYELKDSECGVKSGFKCNTVEHITLNGISKNQNLDPIFEKHDPILNNSLDNCNFALKFVTKKIMFKLQEKLLEKQKLQGKSQITEGDNRRWNLPNKSEGFKFWNVPFESDPDWPQELIEAVNDYREKWRAKMNEVNDCIRMNAEQKELIDKPIKLNRDEVVRVTGPFSVEAVQPPEISLSDLGESTVTTSSQQANDEFVETSLNHDSASDGFKESTNLNAYLNQMIQLLRSDGVRFTDNKQMEFSELELVIGNENAIHAEGNWRPEGKNENVKLQKPTVAVGFGPQYGPVSAMQVEQLIRTASKFGYDDLVIAGFSFDGVAQAIIDDPNNPNIRIHMAHICPDVNPGMNGLLKEKPGSQLFTVFGRPRTKLLGPDKENCYKVVMEGVDIYNPVENTTSEYRADKVAAWFIDSDYDSRTFCITQVFFPDKSVWGDLQKTLDHVIEQDTFRNFSGNESLPFPVGSHKRVAVKVIDPRGNEVMSIHKLEEDQ